jgi:chemotaxis protein MotB
MISGIFPTKLILKPNTMKPTHPEFPLPNADTLSLPVASTHSPLKMFASGKVRFPVWMSAVCIVLSLLFLPSCKSTSPLAKKLDTFFQSKRYKRTVIQRDSLQQLCNLLRTDTTDIGKNLRNSKEAYSRLEDKYMLLDDKYTKLANTSGQKLEKLSAALDAKSKELDSKESMLLAQEKKLREMQEIISRQDSVTNRLNAIVKDALLGFKSDELSVKVKNGKVYVSMSDKLLFKSGSAAVEPKGLEAIQKLAEVLNKNTDIDIFIEGHTDNVPIKTAHYADNWDLSVARATNIVRLLIEKYTVNPKRLTASGKGENFPVASNDTPEGRAKNRRTEIVLSPKLDELFDLLQRKR